MRQEIIGQNPKTDSRTTLLYRLEPIRRDDRHRFDFDHEVGVSETLHTMSEPVG